MPLPLEKTFTLQETNNPSCLEAKSHDLSEVILSPEEERKLWRKIDIRLLPIISLMYLFSFMDRGE